MYAGRESWEKKCALGHGNRGRIGRSGKRIRRGAVVEAEHEEQSWKQGRTLDCRRGQRMTTGEMV